METDKKPSFSDKYRFAGYDSRIIRDKSFIPPTSDKPVTIDRIPGDKSITHRAIILGSLAEGRTRIYNYLASHDCQATRKAFETMGVKITDISPGAFEIEGVGMHGLQAPTRVIDARNSGTTMRLLSGLLAGQKFNSVLTGDQYLKKRPMQRVLTPLSLMGARMDAMGGGKYAPITIRGTKLTGIEYKLPVASAQVKSAILLAGLYAQGETTVIEPVSTRDHTERMLAGFGVEVRRKNQRITVSPNNRLTGCDLTIPADFSSAAFWMVAGLILPGLKVTLKQVGVNPTRTGLLTILERMGANIKIVNQRELCGEPIADIEVISSPLHGTVVGGEIIPKLIDEIPILAVAASYAQGTTVIKDASELRVKETDRIKAMAAELSKLGVDIEEKPDGMIIQGREKLTEPASKLENYGDHRIAMSLFIAAFCSKLVKNRPDLDCISSSYPLSDFKTYGISRFRDAIF